MQNLPRIYLNEKLEVGKLFPLPADTGHYLSRVMRVKERNKEKGIRNKTCEEEFIVFNNGKEFYAKLIEEKTKKNLIPYSFFLIPLAETGRPDPSNNLTLAFAPVKQSRLEEIAGAATQLGVARLLPVITERTNERHIHWERIRKITIEASEQSGRNSIPEILPEMPFDEFMKECSLQSVECNELIFADERFVHNPNDVGANNIRPQNTDEGKGECYSPLQTLLIGPEGGFSESEFAQLDAAGAHRIGLGPTILRAEVAAVVAIAKVNSEQ